MNDCEILDVVVGTNVELDFSSKIGESSGDHEKPGGERSSLYLLMKLVK